MKSTKLVYAQDDKDKKYLLPLGDLHLGSNSCDKELLKGYVDWALEKEAWVLLMGDLIENATRNSVGAGVYEQILPVDDQKDEIEDLFRPLADKGLILGSLTGNHEERTFKESGSDPGREIARRLQVPYLRYSGFLRLGVREQYYTVFATHGSSGAATPGGKLSAISKLAHTADADLYLMGHVHTLASSHTVQRYVDLRKKTVDQRRRVFVITGSFLGYDDSYSEMKCFQPEKMGAPRIRLSGEEHDIHVSI